MLLDPRTFAQLLAARPASAVAFGDLVPADTRPAGDVVPEALRTGVPAAQYSDGPWLFRASILFVGAIPNLDATALGEAFAAELARLSGARLGATTRPTVEGVSAPATSVDVPDGRGGTRRVEALWITVSGELLAVAPFATELVQRALAPALATAVRGWDPVDAAYRDQTAFVSSLALVRLRAANACTGGADLRSVVARACLRIAPVEARAALGSAPTPPIPPVPPVELPAVTPPPAPPPAVPLTPAQNIPGYPRTVRTAARFWLRPRATFNREGPEYPPGTVVIVLGPAVGTQGSLSLYPVELPTVPAARGYAALSAADLTAALAVAPAPLPPSVVPVTPVRLPGLAAPVTPVTLPGPAAPVPVTPVALPGQPAPVPVTRITIPEVRTTGGTTMSTPTPTTMRAPSSAWKWALGLGGVAAFAAGVVAVVVVPARAPRR